MPCDKNNAIILRIPKPVKKTDPDSNHTLLTLLWLRNQKALLLSWLLSMSTVLIHHKSAFLSTLRQEQILAQITTSNVK